MTEMDGRRECVIGWEEREEAAVEGRERSPDDAVERCTLDQGTKRSEEVARFPLSILSLEIR